VSLDLTGFTLFFLSCVSGIFGVLLINPGYQVGITIPLPSSIFFLLPIAVGAAC